MRKKKENISLNAQRHRDEDEIAELEALETAREEDMEAIDGESSTEGVGPGFTSADSGLEHVSSADGPVSGDWFEPPTRHYRIKRGKARGTKKSKHPEEWLDKGNHTAARSSKKI
ncbi:MAG TPA: hypothetical protein VEJ63_01520 [Planctomycetota bacterium]|nr:hypothetical protein [Planctomycetota bacterium]